EHAVDRVRIGEEEVRLASVFYQQYAGNGCKGRRSCFNASGKTRKVAKAGERRQHGMVSLLLAEGLGKPRASRAGHVPAPLSQLSDVRDGPLYTRSGSYARRRQCSQSEELGAVTSRDGSGPVSSSRQSYKAQTFSRSVK